MIAPRGDRVLARRIEGEEIVGGVIIPENAKRDTGRAVVVAVGPGEWSDTLARVVELGLNVGDTIICAKYGGQMIEVDGEELLVLRDAEIIAVETEAGAGGG